MESPCCHCEKDRGCKRSCDIWIEWFTKQWQRIRQAGNKTNGGDPSGS